MASFISNTVFDALKRDLELAMIKLVADIAAGEGLDAQELQDKYLKDITVGKPVKAKATRKAKVSVTPVDPDATQDPNAPAVLVSCSCLTAKGGPCKLKPLQGTTMCGIHTKKMEAERGMPEGAATGPIKPKRASKKKAAPTEELAASDVDLEEGGAASAASDVEASAPAPKKKRAPPKKKAAAVDEVDEDGAGPSTAAPKKKRAASKKKTAAPAPVHTHELDDETHDDCELCQTHGCPLEDAEAEYETVMSPPRTLRERLARAAAMEEMFTDDDE
jgi:histone H1/5